MNLNKEALKEAIKTNVFNSMHFRIHCKNFFQQKGKKSYEKVEWYKCLLHLQSSFCSNCQKSL